MQRRPRRRKVRHALELLHRKQQGDTGGEGKGGKVKGVDKASTAVTYTVATIPENVGVWGGGGGGVLRIRPRKLCTAPRTKRRTSRVEDQSTAWAAMRLSATSLEHHRLRSRRVDHVGKRHRSRTGQQPSQQRAPGKGREMQDTGWSSVLRDCAGHKCQNATCVRFHDVGPEETP